MVEISCVTLLGTCDNSRLRVGKGAPLTAPAAKLIVPGAVVPMLQPELTVEKS